MARHDYKEYARMLQRINTNMTGKHCSSRSTLTKARVGCRTERKHCQFCETETEHVNSNGYSPRAINGTLSEPNTCVQCDGGLHTC